MISSKLRKWLNVGEFNNLDLQLEIHIGELDPQICKESLEKLCDNKNYKKFNHDYLGRNLRNRYVENRIKEIINESYK